MSSKNQAQMIRHHILLALRNDDASILKGVETYITNTPLGEEAILELISALSISFGRDSILDGYEKLVMIAGRFNELSSKAERKLIETGNHRVIMYYIENSKTLLKEDALLIKRGNEKEVSAYFKRYSKG